MIPYYILIFSPFLISLVRFTGQTDEQKRRMPVNLFFFLYLTMLMLRHVTVGHDLPGYATIFSRLGQIGWQYVFRVDMEPAYVILNKLIYLFTDNFQWCIAIVSALIVIPIWYVYRKTSDDPLLSVSMFLILPTFVMFFSGLRQSIAIGLGALAFEMTRRKKLIPFLLVCALATAFHYSAFILLLMYPLYHARITRAWLIAVIPAMGLIYLFNEPIFALIQQLLSDYYEAEITESGAYTMLMLFVLFGIYSYLIPDEAQLDAETIGLRNLLLLSIAIQMFVPLNNLAMRMNYYYIIFIPLLLPKIHSARNARWTQVARLARYVMILYFLVYFFDHMPSGNILDTFPYRFFGENIV